MTNWIEINDDNENLENRWAPSWNYTASYPPSSVTFFCSPNKAIMPLSRKGLHGMKKTLVKKKKNG